MKEWKRTCKLRYWDHIRDPFLQSLPNLSTTQPLVDTSSEAATAKLLFSSWAGNELSQDQVRRGSWVLIGGEDREFEI